MHVREARVEDAEAMSRVLVASITALCERDHGGVRTHLDQWLANKSPAGVSAWFATGRSKLIVAERDGVIVGVGGFSGDGVVLLNYVAPEARFSGVSTALLAAAEAGIRAAGLRAATLTSTVTAHAFYLARGWRDAGPPRSRFAVLVHSMTKALA